VAEIKAVIAELPTYGYRRVHAILKRQALAAGLMWSADRPQNRQACQYRPTEPNGAAPVI
jgi:hypothetical protein